MCFSSSSISTASLFLPRHVHRFFPMFTGGQTANSLCRNRLKFVLSSLPYPRIVIKIGSKMRLRSRHGDIRHWKCHPENHDLNLHRRENLNIRNLKSIRFVLVFRTLFLSRPCLRRNHPPHRITFHDTQMRSHLLHF